MEKLLTIDEVAEMLRVHRNTVEGWLHSGALSGYKLGGKLWRIPESALDEFLKKGEKGENND